MVIVGLTGSIGMGKSETAKMFRRLGIAVYDADAAVHGIYAPGGSAVAPIEEAFPGVTGPNGVDRDALAKRVLNDPAALKKLESIVHPLVGLEQQKFLAQAAAEKAEMIVIDVPLLYETGGQKRVDCVVLVSAPYELQRERVLARPGMSEEKFQSILAKQVPDAQKREQADYIIDSSKGLEAAMAQVEALIPLLRKVPARAWAQRKQQDATG
ncbi:MAG TPA: dephospho-CoA kinase [Alphaproteobacteria bacterium]|nr:dephospho-CoA kinase [Alphaproteobacteria bacterium]